MLNLNSEKVIVQTTACVRKQWKNDDQLAAYMFEKVWKWQADL